MEGLGLFFGVHLKCKRDFVNIYNIRAAVDTVKIVGSMEFTVLTAERFFQ